MSDDCGPPVPPGAPLGRDEQVGVLFEVLREQAQRLRTKHDPSSLALSAVGDALARGIAVPWGDAARFIALARRLLRNKIVDRYRREEALKRPKTVNDVELESMAQAIADHALRLDVESALLKLDERCPKEAEVVRLFYCGGFNDQEIAAELDISDDQVRRRRMNGLVTLRIWLRGANTEPTS